MGTVNTRADSLRLFLTGAGSDGGAQTNDNLALGNYRSATEITVLGAVITSPISNVTVDFVGYKNGTGAGTLTAASASTLTWTPPGGTAGAAVSIADGESKLLEGGGVGGANKIIRVTRTSATALSGAATVTLADVLNNAIGFDNVSSAEAAAGDSEYRCIMLKNANSVTIAGVKVYVGTLGTQRVSGTAQLGASGSGTITSATAGAFDDWPASGGCRITQSGGTLREIVYYSSRTSTSLTVPSAGRGLLGTSAGAGSGTDTVDAVPLIRIGKEAPSAPTNGFVQTIANEGTAPTGITWNTAITAALGLSIGDLGAGEMYGVWIHRLVTVGEESAPTVLHKLETAFDAA